MGVEGALRCVGGGCGEVCEKSVNGENLFVAPCSN